MKLSTFFFIYLLDLKSRGLPEWIFDKDLVRYVRKRYSYFDICRNTPVLFISSYWDGVQDRSDWPKDKPIYVIIRIYGEL